MMKKLILLLLAAASLLVSCTSFEVLVDEGGDCTLLTPDGKKAKFQVARIYTPNVISSCTDGKYYSEYASLNLYYEGDVRSGNIQVDRMELTLPLSSTGLDHTHVFSGKVGIVKVADSYLVLRLKNVKYNLSQGEYVLDGDLVVATGDLHFLKAPVKDGAMGGKYHISVNHWKNDTGTWSTDLNDITYKYLGVLTGMDGIPEKEVGYVVLTNDLSITFDEVKRSMYSSNSQDWIPEERARLIGFYY